jgi:hypothetical protein
VFRNFALYSDQNTMRAPEVPTNENAYGQQISPSGNKNIPTGITSHGTVAHMSPVDVSSRKESKLKKNPKDEKKPIREVDTAKIKRRYL